MLPAACTNILLLCRFIGATAPESLKGAALEYCAEHFLVHLDDPSSKIQNAVFHVLSTLAHIDAAAVVKKINNVSASHRDPTLCNELMKKVNLHVRRHTN